MKSKLLAAAGLAATLGFGASPAHAIQAVINWTNIDNYNLDLSAAFAAAPTFSGGDAVIFTGYSLTDFFDKDSSGGISINDTFNDYIVVRSTIFVDDLNNEVGSFSPTTYELTYVIEATGKITSAAGGFLFNSISRFDAYLDDITNGGSKALFGAPDFTKFFDGTNVLTGPSPLVNAGVVQGGALAPTPGANGEFSLAFEIQEVLAAAGFLQDVVTTSSIFDEWERVAYLPDGDLTFLDPTLPTSQAIANQFIGEFGPLTGGTLLASVAIDGRVDLAAVPEPSVLALLGLGLMGIGCARKLGKRA
jgi:hypothetical protein